MIVRNSIVSNAIAANVGGHGTPMTEDEIERVRKILSGVGYSFRPDYGKFGFHYAIPTVESGVFAKDDAAKIRAAQIAQSALIRAGYKRLVVGRGGVIHFYNSSRVALNFSLVSFAHKLQGFAASGKPLPWYTLDAIEREVKAASGDIAKVSGAAGIVSRILATVAECRKKIKSVADGEWIKRYGKPKSSYKHDYLPANDLMAEKLRGLLSALAMVSDNETERRGAESDKARAERDSRKRARDFERRNGDSIRAYYDRGGYTGD